MPLEPLDWNVVVIGRWNRAILTPRGIAKRLFDLAEGTKVEIGMSVDAVGPYRVRHENMTVMVDEYRLIVEPRESDHKSLEAAMKIAWRALDQLPETPVAAAGYNLRFRCPLDSEAAKPLVESTELLWDGRFAESGYKVLNREVTWTVGWDAGKIRANLTRDQEARETQLGLNFERSSAEIEDLKFWMEMPIERIIEQQGRLFGSIFCLRAETLA